MAFCSRRYAALAAAVLGLAAFNLIFRLGREVVSEWDESLYAISALEMESAKRNQTQMFIETPYRNERLFAALLATCRPQTLLCIATDITLDSEDIQTLSAALWKTRPAPALNKRPSLFLMLAVIK